MKIQEIVVMGLMFSMFISGFTIFLNDWGSEYGVPYNYHVLNATREFEQATKDIRGNYSDDIEEDDNDIFTLRGTVKYLGTVMDLVTGIYDGIITDLGDELTGFSGADGWISASLAAILIVILISVVIGAVLNRPQM